MHYYKAGEVRVPLVVKLYVFSKLADSWCKLIVPLANLDFIVVALDQRSYGKTTGQTLGRDVDPAEFGVKNLKKDFAQFVEKLGYLRSELFVVHDFGSPEVNWTAFIYLIK